MRTAVVIMSKIPQPGFTKTRLNSILSEQESADFHRACLMDTCRAIRKSKLPGYIYYAGEYESSPRLQESLVEDDMWGLPPAERSYFQMYPQRGEDLGERLYHAAHDVLNVYEAVLFVGSDMPDISADIILEAQQRIFSTEIVVGPAYDGGYYLLGVKKAHREIFQNIPWGTIQVLAKTMERIKENNLTYALLQPHADIDTWDDLKNFYNSAKVGERNSNRQLSAYENAARLVEKYSSHGEGV